MAEGMTLVYSMVQQIKLHETCCGVQFHLLKVICDMLVITLASMYALGLMRVELRDDLEAGFIVTAVSWVWLMSDHNHRADGGFVRPRSMTCISVLAHQT